MKRKLILLSISFSLLLSTSFKEFSITITGIVTSAKDGSPVSGVNVIVKGTTIGTVTDINGWYTIEVPSKNSVLIFSFIGLATQEVQIKEGNKLNVSMTAEITELSEVVVTRTGNKLLNKIRGIAPFKKEKNEAYSPIILSYDQEINTEEYDEISENTFHNPRSSPYSTFSIDVDGASYSNARRMINLGQNPPKDAIRIEEFINYFDYGYESPKGNTPFSVTTEVGVAPWNEKHQLVHVGIQGKKLDYDDLKPSNLVFLVDVSGSMSSNNKLPLFKQALKILANELQDDDRVAIVTYAGAAGLALPSTKASQKEKIFEAINAMNSGGSTAGGAGIKLAYKVAQKNFLEEGNNRIILATDGDFNVGVSSNSEMVKLIEKKRKSGIYLTITGLGMGNYKDGKMEQISNAGNGNYFYIDNIQEAKKVFSKDLRANLFTIAKDVKIQVEFNPKKVQAYRLIGYENRKLNDEDFNDDQKDAGELGAGHTVTALYEIIPTGVKSSFSKSIDPLKYQTKIENKESYSSELMTVKLRYKLPKENKSKLIETIVSNKNLTDKHSDYFLFSAAVAEFGMLLRDSEFKSDASYENVLAMAKNSLGKDEEGYKREFLRLVESVKLMNQ